MSATVFVNNLYPFPALLHTKKINHLISGHFLYKFISIDSGKTLDIKSI